MTRCASTSTRPKLQKYRCGIPSFLTKVFSGKHSKIAYKGCIQNHVNTNHMPHIQHLGALYFLMLHAHTTQIITQNHPGPYTGLVGQPLPHTTLTFELQLCVLPQTQTLKLTNYTNYWITLSVPFVTACFTNTPHPPDFILYVVTVASTCNCHNMVCTANTCIAQSQFYEIT